MGGARLWRYLNVSVRLGLFFLIIQTEVHRKDNYEGEDEMHLPNFRGVIEMLYNESR